MAYAVAAPGVSARLALWIALRAAAAGTAEPVLAIRLVGAHALVTGALLLAAAAGCAGGRARPRS